MLKEGKNQNSIPRMTVTKKSLQLKEIKKCLQRQINSELVINEILLKKILKYVFQTHG